LRSLAAITERCIDKKSGKESLETRLFISSLAPEPKAMLDAVRSHWGIENNLHWCMDVIFDEDRCKTRKDNSPLNLAIIRHAAFNVLKADKTKGSEPPRVCRRPGAKIASQSLPATARPDQMKDGIHHVAQ
jgi:predicted transposase YbfD/YdcC